MTPHPHTFVLSYLAEKQFLQVTLEETHTSLKTREAELSPSTDGRADCISGDEVPGRSPFHQPEQVSFCWGCFDTSHVLCSPHTLKSRPSTHTQCALPFPLSIHFIHTSQRQESSKSLLPDNPHNQVFSPLYRLSTLQRIASVSVLFLVKF